MSDHHRIRW